MSLLFLEIEEKMRVKMMRFFAQSGKWHNKVCYIYLVKYKFQGSGFRAR